jgi:hypothetical protein
MFGAVTIQVPSQQENIPPNLTTNPNDKTLNENNDEAMVIETIQYQLPSTENITQHRHKIFPEATSKTPRTGFSFLFLILNSSFMFSGLRLQCLTERDNLLLKHEAVYRDDCQRAKLLKRSVPTNVYEISDP